MSESFILGMNERNLSFIRPYNKKHAIKLADDKLATKKLLIKTGIPTPKLYGVIRNLKNLEEFAWNKLPAKFVIKPNRGLGGEGIVILYRKVKKEKFIKIPLEKREWFTSSGERWDFERLRSHILDILDGNFAIAGLPDIAFIERRLTTHPAFKEYTRKGIPDIRVIVFNRVPVMAMLRLPTEKSKGRANLAQGAVGVGLDISTGIATNAMMKLPYHKTASTHPDTEKNIIGFEVPFWNKILEMSVEAQIASDIGFLGVDIAIDKRYGPEILELNARAGLDIQLANMAGLAGRLKRVKGLKVKSVSHGVRIAKDLFGGDVERRVEEISGMEVVGIIENVDILNKKGTKKIKVKAKVDTGAESTSIDRDLAVKLGFKDAIKFQEEQGLAGIMTKEEADKFDEDQLRKKMIKHEDIVDFQRVKSAHGASFRIIVPATFYLEGRKVLSKTNITNRKGMKYPMIIGRNDLKNFLVDPLKNLPSRK